MLPDDWPMSTQHFEDTSKVAKHKECRDERLIITSPHLPYMEPPPPLPHTPFKLPNGRRGHMCLQCMCSGSVKCVHDASACAQALLHAFVHLSKCFLMSVYMFVCVCMSVCVSLWVFSVCAECFCVYLSVWVCECPSVTVSMPLYTCVSVIVWLWYLNSKLIFWSNGACWCQWSISGGGEGKQPKWIHQRLVSPQSSAPICKVLKTWTCLVVLQGGLWISFGLIILPIEYN